MEYRRLPKGTEEISVIGFGGSGLHQAGEKAGAETVLAAIEQGVNYFDMAVSEAAAFKSYRAAFAGRREQVYLQMHFGADYSSGQYGWTTDIKRIKNGMDWLLRELDTDYIDFGFIHCIDQPADLEKYINSGALAADHYRKLELHAGDCVSCGHCDGRCPFHVRQSDRMAEIAGYFGL